jgi:capsular polysaccharide biosynthesis protein
MDAVAALRKPLGLVKKLDVEVVDDKFALIETPNVFWKSTEIPPGEGVWSTHTPTVSVRDKDLRKRLRDHTAGDPLPEWHDGAGGALRLDTYVLRVKDVVHTPQFGAVIDTRGRLFRRTAAEARYLSPTLDQLPNMRAKRDILRLAVPGGLPRFERATVFMPWGARFNYGHFVLDALSGLAVIDDMNGLEAYPPIAPPLNSWQRDLLRLYLGDRAGLVREVADEMVSIDDVVFTNCMDHFLHAPNAILKLVRERIRTNAALLAPHQESPRLLYLERADEKRMMVNQDKLINLLRLRGFAIVQPETLSVAEQVKLFSKAEVIVSATGAGLTNALFAPQNAKVFEIQPSNFTGIWVRQMCDVIGLGWYGYFCESPLKTKDFYTEGKLRSDVLFQYRLPLDPFISFLSSRAGV